MTPMHRVRLDEIDLKILAAVQENGRITNVELSERVGITAPPCLRRVRALEDAGFIRGYHAELDQNALGYGITAFALVGLHSQAESDLKAFEGMVNDWPLVRECHMLSGEIDFILKIVARDLAQFQSFLTGHLTAAPNVDSVKTSLTIRCAKKKPGVPLDLDHSRKASAIR
ncbi:MAG: Lrp/AsnC family transcriptional regulator [Sphingomonadales bacterium]